MRHLYTGQLWMPQIGLYDLRNRVYSSTLERFMQTDPFGFGGDAGNLYCRKTVAELETRKSAAATSVWSRTF
ncbi:MAG: hypothetical protein DLM52_07295 [Chthoniobacterales bacterium]|nr:MAG: hypothetical protein DLM52_07295 [Chthoniobacterales bacterium]